MIPRKYESGLFTMHERTSSHRKSEDQYLLNHPKKLRQDVFSTPNSTSVKYETIYKVFEDSNVIERDKTVNFSKEVSLISTDMSKMKFLKAGVWEQTENLLQRFNRNEMDKFQPLNDDLIHENVNHILNSLHDEPQKDRKNNARFMIFIENDLAFPNPSVFETTPDFQTIYLFQIIPALNSVM